MRGVLVALIARAVVTSASPAQAHAFLDHASPAVGARCRPRRPPSACGSRRTSNPPSVM